MPPVLPAVRFRSFINAALLRRPQRRQAPLRDIETAVTSSPCSDARHLARRLHSTRKTINLRGPGSHDERTVASCRVVTSAEHRFVSYGSYGI